MEEGFNKLNKRSLTDLFNFLKWLWRDAFHRYKKDVIISTVSSIVRLITQFGALAIIFTYASGLESHRTFSILDYQFHSRTSGLLLIIVSVLGLTIYIISAFSDYISRRTSVSLWKAYELHSLKRFTLLKSRLPHPLCSKANEMLNDESISKDGRTESKHLGRMFSQMLNTIIPITTLLLVTTVLFYISYKFTFIILLFSAISMFFLYKISIQILQNMDNLKIYSKSYLPEKTKLLNRINKIVSPITDNEFFFENIFSRGEMRKFQDAFFNTFFLREKTNLIVNILTGISIITIIAISGIGLLYGSFNWAIFLAYIVLLQYFLGSLMQLGNFISTFSRFYPEAKRYYEFVSDAEKSRYHTENIKLDNSSIYLKATDLDKKSDSVELKSGKITYLYNPKGVNRNIASILNNNTVLNNGYDDRYFYWFMQNIDFSGMTIRQSHGFPNSVKENTLYQDLTKILDETNLRHFEDIRLDDVLIGENHLALSDIAKFSLQLLSAIYSNRKVLLFNEKDYYGLQDLVGQKLEELLSNRVIILITNGKKIPQFEDDDTVYLISSSSKLVSWCNSGWIINNSEEIDKLLKSVSAEEALQTNISYIAEELDE